MRGDVETFYDGDRWVNRVVGSYMVANQLDTKEDAEAKGRRMATMRKVTHVILAEDGSIVSSDAC